MKMAFNVGCLNSCRDLISTHCSEGQLRGIENELSGLLDIFIANDGFYSSV